MGRKIIFLILMFSAAGCSDFKFHVKKDAHKIKPAVILIGQFDLRNMNYDPYVSDEFRDALKFEFFRRGYNSVSVIENGIIFTDESDRAAKICAAHSGDILIKGVISQRESGFLADRETDTLISFTVYRKDGIVLGEGFYHDKHPAGEESLRRDAADEFVSELIKNFEQIN